MRRWSGPPTDPSAYPFVHRVRARFAETDAMGIVHHAAYLPYLEETRVEYLRWLGRPYQELQAEGLALSVVEAHVAYRRPVRFDEVVDVHLKVASVGAAVLELAYLLTSGGTVRASAVTVHGAVGRDGRPLRLPAWLRELVTSTDAGTGSAS